MEHLTYLELIAYFRAYGNVRFEIIASKVVFNNSSIDGFEYQYKHYNGKVNRILRANKNIMLTLKKSIEENKVKIIKL